MTYTKQQLKVLINNLDDNKEYELKEHKPKRSIQANNYFWTLLGELCFELDLNVLDEYKKRVKELGIFRQWTIDRDNLKTFNKMWTSQGIAWFTEVVDIAVDNKIVVNAYYGSSSYNSKQMAKLIDGLVQDCRAVGIETRTTEEINSLLKGVDESENIKKDK